MKVIIAGSRGLKDYKTVEEAVKKSGFEVTEIVSGGARGADILGEKYASENNLPVKIFKPDWDYIDVPKYKIKKNKFGKLYNVGAGFERNEEMAKYADALIAIWDGKSNGTKHMIKCMSKKGGKVFVENYNGS